MMDIYTVLMVVLDYRYLIWKSQKPHALGSIHITHNDQRLFIGRQSHDELHREFQDWYDILYTINVSRQDSPVWIGYDRPIYYCISRSFEDCLSSAKLIRKSRFNYSKVTYPELLCGTEDGSLLRYAEGISWDDILSCIRGDAQHFLHHYPKRKQDLNKALRIVLGESGRRYFQSKLTINEGYAFVAGMEHFEATLDDLVGESPIIRLGPRDNQDTLRGRSWQDRKKEYQDRIYRAFEDLDQRFIDCSDTVNRFERIDEPERDILALTIDSATDDILESLESTKQRLSLPGSISIPKGFIRYQGIADGMPVASILCVYESCKERASVPEGRILRLRY